MIHGMTGFAERGFRSGALRLKLGIKTLNHRFFDWSYKGPAIGGTENALRALAQRKLHRGRVEVALDLISLDPGRWVFAVNEPLLEKILDSFDRVARRVGRPVEFTLDGLFRIPQLVVLDRKPLAPAEARFIERSFERTLDSVIRARRVEGAETARRIREHGRLIARAVTRLERAFAKQPARIQARLRQKVRDLAPAGPSEEKLIEETAFLAQRYDLAEEIGRLRSHLKTLSGLLSPDRRGPVGKELDFLAQELGREANTVGSKSQDLEITRESLAIKTEVESIRQHVQNLE